VIALVGTLVAASWPLLPADAGARGAVAAGGALAALNTILAYALVLWSRDRSTNAFLGAVLGGMVGRMGLMLVGVLVLVLLLEMPKVPLAASLLSFFVLFLVVELAILHRRTSAPARAR
jgi:hypothetical protein